jgi:signal transduction histidine kinase
VYGPLTKTQMDTLATIQNQVQSLHRLVRQLLDISRFEAGGGRLEPRVGSLSKFLDDLESSFHVLALQRDVRFSVNRAPGLPDEVVWDIDRMNEVLGNLLSNAFKFTSKTGRVDLNVEVDHNCVVMMIRDTGAGIPPEQLPRIFEKFYQADNQGSASAAGSGLGLAIAKQIVEAHGGTISCDSTVGVGTTFTIRLPEHVQRRSASIHLTAVPT